MNDTGSSPAAKCLSSVVHANGADSTLDLAHGIDRLLLRLVVRAGKHFADQPDRNQLDSTHDKNDRHEQERTMFLNGVDVVDEFFENETQADGAAGSRAQETPSTEKLHRLCGIVEQE